ncbi:unnamed protein product [Taenia asiatica]|uniref:Protein RER1 n=1 Tax=Taenia asiatica TaxID=60517 RepID=A0A0R3W3B5_TAEAS|nr:unnamed protein product [Taenia asiatica]
MERYMSDESGADEASESNRLSKVSVLLKLTVSGFFDKIVPYTLCRWLFFFGVLTFYIVRVAHLQDNRKNCTIATIISILCTFFSFFDLPVFWPILLIYFLTLFYVTMRRQIEHMIRYKYLPFTYGKPRPQGRSTLQSI